MANARKLLCFVVRMLPMRITDRLPLFKFTHATHKWLAWPRNLLVRNRNYSTWQTDSA